ncbi:MAG: hypothetical protein QOD99_216, partial [Chthoniobacter sp.]|jgi:hypothetical protein|nr:hypothetical protein [Chthoniobacter sp.]
MIGGTEYEFAADGKLLNKEEKEKGEKESKQEKD